MENALIICFRSQWECCMSFAAGDLISSDLFTARAFVCVLYVFNGVCLLGCRHAFPSVFSSAPAAMFASNVLFVLMEARAYVLSLRWLRVMVTLKVCVCCSSILSSSDTLMKGHQANA